MRDDDNTVDFREALDQSLAQIQSGKPDSELQRHEMAYRRGYLQGWSDLTDVIFSRLLEQGVSHKDAYKAVARIENEVIGPWRDDLRIQDHHYNLENFLKNDGSEVSPE